MVSCRGVRFHWRSITVEPVMFLYMYSVFTLFLTFQALVYKKVCIEHFNTTVCDNLKNSSYKAEEDVVQKKTSTWILYNTLSMGLPSIFSVVFFLGPWGDRVGRKVPILFPLVGAFLSAINNMLNAIYISAPIPYLLIGNTINGISGGFIACMMAVYSYISHVSTAESRTVRIGVLEAMIFLSGTLGAATSGVMLDNTSFMAVFGFVAGVLLLTFIYTIVWVENVQTETDERHGDVCHYYFLDSVLDTVRCVYQKRQYRHLGKLVLLLIVIALLMLCTVGESDILLLYTRREPFNWSQTTVGLYKGSETFVRGIAVLTLLSVFKWKIKARDTTIVIIGLVSKMASFIVLGIGKKTFVLFLGSLSGILQGFPAAGIRSMCSSMVAKNEQAKIFSIIAVMESIATVVATSVFNTVYNATLDLYSGLCFMMAAIILLICIGIVSLVHVLLRGESFVYETLQEPFKIDEGETTYSDGSLSLEATDDAADLVNPVD